MRNKTLSLIIFLALGFSNSSVAQRIEGPYTKIISALPFQELHPLSGKEHVFKCLSSKQDPLLIGAFHQTIIKAPFEKVRKVYENFEAYPEFISAFKKMKTIQTEKQNVLISIEGAVPFFFIPNSHYDLWYDTKYSDPTTVVYTCQLSKSNDLVSMDGLTVIKKISDQESSFFELDFVNGQWGIAKTLTPKMIWNETIRGFFSGDHELRIRAEMLEISGSEVKKKAQANVISKEVETCIEQKVEAQTLIDQLHRPL